MKSCIIMGNGPSLNKVDINKLKGIDTFSVNGAFMSYDEWGFNPTYYCIIDGNSTRFLADEIKNLIKNNKKINNFFLYDSKNEFKFAQLNDERVSVITGFGNDIKLNEWENKIPSTITTLPEQFSVTAYVVQIAIMLGYTNIGMVGVDARYIPRKDVKIDGVYTEGELKGKPKVIFTSDNDPNHYNPSYHGTGHMTSRSNLTSVAGNDLTPYKNIATMGKNSKVIIKSCTEGSRINGILPYVDYEEFIKNNLNE